MSPVDATTNVGAGNWKGLGMWAWLLFRIAGLVLVRPVRIAEGLDAELAEMAVQEPVHPAVQGAAVDHRVPGAQIGHQHRGHGRHAGGEDRADLPVIQGRQTLFHHVEIGVAEPRIDQARCLAAGHGDAFEEVGVGVLGELGAGIDEGRGEVERRLGRARGGGRIIAHADGQGVEAEPLPPFTGHCATTFSGAWALRPPPRKSTALAQYQSMKRRTSTSASEE